MPCLSSVGYADGRQLLGWRSWGRTLARENNSGIRQPDSRTPGSGRESKGPHEARAVMLEFVAECTPEGHRSQIIDSDNCVQPDRAAVLETPLARTHEAFCEPAAPVIWVNDQPIEAASPPVPRC